MLKLSIKQISKKQIVGGTSHKSEKFNEKFQD